MQAETQRRTDLETYTTKSGLQQYKCPAEALHDPDADITGFCLACGEMQEGVEPDAGKYECECCGEPKVYGLMELALRGLVSGEQFRFNKRSE